MAAVSPHKSQLKCSDLVAHGLFCVNIQWYMGHGYWPILSILNDLGQITTERESNGIWQRRPPIVLPRTNFATIHFSNTAVTP